MSIGMLNFISGAAQGYQGEKDRQRRQEQEDKDRAFQEEARNRQRQDWKKQDAERAALEGAAKPVQVQTVEAPGTALDVGPSPGSFQAGAAAPVASMEEAQRQAAQQNTPSGVAMRQAAAVEGINPSMAATLRANSRQQELAELQLSEAQAKKIRDDFDRVLSGLPSFEDVARHVSNSKVRGDLKITFVPTADGAGVQAAAVMPDGSIRPSPKSPVYTNDSMGLARAKADLAANTTITDQINWLHHDQKAKAEAAKAALEERKQAHKEEYDDKRLAIDERRTEGMLARMDAQTKAILAKIGSGDGESSVSGVSKKQMNQDFKEGREYIIKAFTTTDQDGVKSTNHRLVELANQVMLASYVASSGDIGHAQSEAARRVTREFEVLKKQYPGGVPPEVVDRFASDMEARLQGNARPRSSKAQGTDQAGTASAAPSGAAPSIRAPLGQSENAPSAEMVRTVQVMFDRDRQTMTPQQLAQKYGGAMSSLTTDQRRALGGSR